MTQSCAVVTVQELFVRIEKADPINVVRAKLYDAFARLPAPRVDRTKGPTLVDIINIAICAVICGADSWVAARTFGKRKQAWLERYLALPNGIASHDTFGRVFAALDATSFQPHFLAWVQAIWPPTAGEIMRFCHAVAVGWSSVQHTTQNREPL